MYPYVRVVIGELSGWKAEHRPERPVLPEEVSLRKAGERVREPVGTVFFFKKRDIVGLSVKCDHCIVPREIFPEGFQNVILIRLLPGDPGDLFGETRL